MKDYYKILGINNDADYQTIKSAYRNLIKKYHPDVNKSEDASEKFIETHEAFSILRDKVKRDAYDQAYHRYYNNDDVNNSVNQEDIDKDFEKWISDSLKQAKDLMKQPLAKKVKTVYNTFLNIMIIVCCFVFIFYGLISLPSLSSIIFFIIGGGGLWGKYDDFKESKTLYDFLTELED
jgi:hypothetical protein